MQTPRSRLMHIDEDNDEEHGGLSMIDTDVIRELDDSLPSSPVATRIVTKKIKPNLRRSNKNKKNKGVVQQAQQMIEHGQHAHVADTNDELGPEPAPHDLQLAPISSSAQSTSAHQSHDILHAIRSHFHENVMAVQQTPSSSSSFSLLLQIKQMNESVADMMHYNHANIAANHDSVQILQYINEFNANIVGYLQRIQQKQADVSSAAAAVEHGPVTDSATTTTAVSKDDNAPSSYTNAMISPYHSHTNSVDQMNLVDRRTFTLADVDQDKESSNNTNEASEGKPEQQQQQLLQSQKPPKVKTPQEKQKEKDEQRKQLREIKRRNIDENFNFFESYFVLKQETNYRMHSQQHYSGKLGLKNISRLQLLRLINNMVTRKTDLSPFVSHSELTTVLRAIFFSKLNGKKFNNISYVRFKKILNLDMAHAQLEQNYNVSFKIYQNVKKYFEKKSAKKLDGMSRKFRASEIEDFYQGKLYVDRKFFIMDEILYPQCEYEQMFKVDDEKATEDEIFDAQNYGDIYRIMRPKNDDDDVDAQQLQSQLPTLLFKKIELECFDDLQSVLNEQYGLKIFDENCQLYFGTEVDYNDDGDEVEYISSRLIMTEYKGSTLAEKIYDYAEENDYLTEYDIGQILYKILIAVQATHRKNVIHCDLKPDNMIVNMLENEDGGGGGGVNASSKYSKEAAAGNDQKKISINLIDFGYCEIVKDEDYVIQNHLIKGTKGYIAPEIYKQYKYGKRSDIYAIGCIGFEMITGGTLPSDYDLHGNYIEPPEDEDEDDDSDPLILNIDLQQVLLMENKKRAFDNRISPKLITFVSKMLSFEYHERYDTAKSVLVARKNWSQMTKPHKHRTAFF
eukprot:CAMPEP_0202695326 /NCGR_PEP_ID=MMETSP1385-20130828/8938_1 /ASSEMBLY_ACC=CAM_ASM_000861 /TAXON_ID=933848 /ORGANISM="Elphidium margaritaceum" /LENGTH=848 /DNA_ID=CAMNT_0049351331 /DNA_START=59 /DNA_END=2605 /DNA_ORIENTATION=-